MGPAGLVTGGEAEGPGPLSHVPISLQVQRVALDQNQLLHLSESVFRGDRVHHLHQRQRQVSRAVVKYPIFERSPVCPSCTHRTAPLIVPSLITFSLPPTSPIADCGALETPHRTPSPPSPPRGVRCPPLWARTAQTAPLQFSALGRWPPGETGLVCLSSPLHGRSGASSWETATTDRHTSSFTSISLSRGHSVDRGVCFCPPLTVFSVWRL